MNVVSFVLSVALAVVVSVCNGQQSSPRTWPIASYFSAYEPNQYEVPAFDWIKSSLAEKNLSQPKEILSFFNETYSNMRMKHTSGVQYNGKNIDVEFRLLALIQLAQNDYAMSKNDVDYYIRLVQHVFGSVEVMGKSSPPSHDVGLFNYLRAYGISKFTSVLNNLNMNNYKQLTSELRLSSEVIFDDFVSSHDEKKSASKEDKYLAQLATSIDFVGGQFNAKKLLKAARRYNPKQRSPNELYAFNKFGSICNSLLTKYYNLLDVFNMVRLMSPESLSQINLPDKLIKYNEYNRICTPRFDDATRNQVRRNIEEGLKSSLSKFVKKVVQ